MSQTNGCAIGGGFFFNIYRKKGPLGFERANFAKTNQIQF
jgi:hypothetical protein